MNKLIDKITVPSLIILLIIAVFYKFNGALHHSFYTQIPQYFTSPEYFTQNLFIKQSTVIYSSIYYTILKYLNIDIYNGICSLLVHFLFSLISIFYSYKIIKILTKNQKFSYLILLCVVYSDFFILSSIQSLTRSFHIQEKVDSDIKTTPKHSICLFHSFSPVTISVPSQSFFLFTFHE